MNDDSPSKCDKVAGGGALPLLLRRRRGSTGGVTGGGDEAKLTEFTAALKFASRDRAFAADVFVKEGTGLSRLPSETEWGFPLGAKEWNRNGVRFVDESGDPEDEEGEADG